MNQICLRRRARRHRVLHLRAGIASRGAQSRSWQARARVVVHHLHTSRSVHAQRGLTRARRSWVVKAAHGHREGLPRARRHATQRKVRYVAVGVGVAVGPTKSSRGGNHGRYSAGLRAGRCWVDRGRRRGRFALHRRVGCGQRAGLRRWVRSSWQHRGNTAWAQRRTGRGQGRGKSRWLRSGLS